MAISVKELGKKAENLIEQGKEADSKMQSCQARVTSANSRVAEARRQLAAASETDEDGNPKGNVEEARVQLNMAMNQLAASQRALSEAKANIEKIKQQKNSHIREIEAYNRVEKSNIDKLKSLKSRAFGSNSIELTEGMISRLNEAEESRVALLRSMGIDAVPQLMSSETYGGDINSWKGGSFSAIDTSGYGMHHEGGSGASDIMLNSKGINTPLGGGLSGLLSNIFGGKSNNQLNPNDYASLQYTNRDELSEIVDFYADDYQSNAEKYNDVIRNHGTSKDIETFINLINSHRIAEDTVFTRRASLRDLGLQYSNLSLEELVGKCYQFEGIMSTAKSGKFSGGDVLFEIHVPKGTPGLDLTNVAYYQEAMFSSPYCYIKSARIEGSNTPYLVVQMISEAEYNLLKDRSC